MEMKQIIGYILLILPFLAFAIFIIIIEGWKVFFWIYGGTILLLTIIGLGIYLIS